MESKIKICGVEYSINPSVLTGANYSIFFDGEDLGEAYYKVIEIMKNIDAIKPKKLTKEEENKLTDIEKKERQLAAIKVSTLLYTETLIALKMAYALIRENDKGFMSFDEWSKSLTNILNEPNWIQEVIGIVANVFRGMVSQENASGQQQNN